MIAPLAGGPFAIVLAAGHGRRMGMPKALIEIDGVTLVEQHVTRLVEIGCRAIVVVLNPDVAARVANMKLTTGESPSLHVVSASTRSQAESLAVGIVALDAAAGPHDDDALLVTPVDLLPPRASVLRDLHAALGRDIDAVTPTFGGKGGHPIVARVRALRAGAAGSPDPLRNLLVALGERRMRLAVDDPCVLGDSDVPSDLAAITSCT